MSSRPVSVTCFSPALASPIASGEGRLRTDYDVEALDLVRGFPAGGVEPGQAWSRVEQPSALALPDAPFVGATQHLVYTDAPTRGELSQSSRGSSGPVAVLIPICKSAAWWALAQEFPESERPAFWELLAILRDPEQNPEWTFVERELEIWMRKARVVRSQSS